MFSSLLVRVLQSQQRCKALFLSLMFASGIIHSGCSMMGSVEHHTTAVKHEIFERCSFFTKHTKKPAEDSVVVQRWLEQPDVLPLSDDLKTLGDATDGVDLEIRAATSLVSRVPSEEQSGFNRDFTQLCVVLVRGEDVWYFFAPPSDQQPAGDKTPLIKRDHIPIEIKSIPLQPNDFVMTVPLYRTPFFTLYDGASHPQCEITIHGAIVDQVIKASLGGTRMSQLYTTLKSFEVKKVSPDGVKLWPTENKLWTATVISRNFGTVTHHLVLSGGKGIATVPLQPDLKIEAGKRYAVQFADGDVVELTNMSLLVQRFGPSEIEK